ncbi:SDR family oxidoreductase [Amaricoccus solimangrovi]|uniref:SDR family oxidoreductase n=1 Tax=Amaricoccus solimangrovi TaxID=2589815 RepID=A0A501WYH5_9RHOB|nr:SDR family oxidoreductase [Amaricoccus solimangrovi]TPE50996.1 SDR family oxidoreductase [Amaricoccus solimangrovi]
MSKPERIALVTGGGGGVGRAAALALAGDGWTVAVAGRRAEALEETAALAEPGRVIALPADVSDPDSVDRLFAALLARHGRLDLLFNNAGVNVSKAPLDELAVEEVRTIVEVNLLGALLCARAALRAMKAQSPRGGRIINNGSVSAYAPRPHSAPYTATKHGMTGLTKSLALDGRPFGIVCGQIDLGNVATDMTSYMAVGAEQADGSVTAEPRMPLGEAGRAVLYMANLPPEANIPFMTLMAPGMPLYGRG